jgi:hypothetical protein
MGDEITMRGQRILTFAKCTTIMIAKLTVTSGPDPLSIRWVLDEIGLVSVRLCVNLCLLLNNNLCLLLDINLCLLLDNNICLLLDNNISLRWDYVFYWTLPPVDIFYLIRILGSSTVNFHLVNRMLITCESSIGAFLHLTLL